jgi:hypothetical protein
MLQVPSEGLPAIFSLLGGTGSRTIDTLTLFTVGHGMGKTVLPAPPPPAL